MRRRYLLTTTGLVFTTLAGCIGDTEDDAPGLDDDTDDGNSETDDEDDAEGESSGSTDDAFDWADGDLPFWTDWLPATIETDDPLEIGYIDGNTVDSWPEEPRQVNNVSEFARSHGVHHFGEFSKIIEIPRPEEFVAFGDFEIDDVEEVAEGERDGFYMVPGFGAISEDVIVHSDRADAYLNAYFEEAPQLVDHHGPVAKLSQTQDHTPIVTFQETSEDEIDWVGQAATVEDGEVVHTQYFAFTSEEALEEVLDEEIEEYREEVNVDVATKGSVLRFIYRREPENVLREEHVLVIRGFEAIAYVPHDH